MDISTSWLREWVNPNVSDEVLADKLTMVGLEVDATLPVAGIFKNIVIGHVLSCEKHHNADRLNVCQVNIGNNEQLQIICGADNIHSNLKVAVATIGVQLPDGLIIKKVKLRGVDSCGMICSSAEMGIKEHSEGILQLSDDAPIGEDIRKYLNLDDNIMTLDITPNRGDCFSVLGIAREVGANYNLPLHMPNINKSAQDKLAIKANVSHTKACPKYLIRTISGIDNTRQTPKWMAEKLIRSGQKLHSPVVDITNFVLLELGQPMHVFDLSALKGNINVRMAKNGEKIELLNETTVKLKSDTLVITDSESVLAIAGVMGSTDSSTQSNTTNIVLESAFFEPVAIAGKARNYSLHTESSLRFERGVDFNITETAMDRATELIIQICGGKSSTTCTCIYKSALPILESITITQTYIKKILGFELDANWIEEKLTCLNFSIINKSHDSWSIMPPSFRFDIRIPADIIEELARLYGYDKLPVQKLSLGIDIKPNSQMATQQHTAVQSLINHGYQEVITYSFISEKYHQLLHPQADKITLKNPISEDMSIMRSSLWAGLLQTVANNQRRGHTDAKFFEIGLCFNGVTIDKQIHKLAAVASGNRFSKQWGVELQPLDFFDIKGDLESLLALTNKQFSFVMDSQNGLQIGQTAKILLANKTIGWVGALSPMVQKQLSLPQCYLFEIDLLSIIKKDTISHYQAFSSYQKSERDIALILDEKIPTSNLIQSIKNMQQQDLVSVSLFDIYSGDAIKPGTKSITLNLSYQSLVATLSDDEVNAKVDDILALMKKQYSATLR